MAHTRRLLAALTSLPLSFLIGCGFGSTVHSTTPAGLSGTIYGGQNPVASSTVTVWQVGNTDYGSPAIPLATTTSGPDGSFTITTPYVCEAPDTQVYITAVGGTTGTTYNNPYLALAAGLGNCSSAQSQVVNINEVTTAVTAFALNNFSALNEGATDAAGDDFGAPAANMPALALSNAHTIPTLVNLPFGTVNPNTSSISIEAAKIYSIANTLAACVNSTSESSACGTLMADTTNPYGGYVPVDTLQAAVNMAFFPYQNVSDLYMLGTSTPPFVGSPIAPNDWTIGVSYTTPTMGLGIAGTANSGTSSTIDIDTTGRVWLPSNLPGATGVGYFDPATASFTGPINATGVTLTQPQYVALDPYGYVWVTDQASNNLLVVDTTNTAPPSAGPISGAVTLGPVSLDYSGDAFLAFTDSNGNPDLGFIDSNTSDFSKIGLFTLPPTGMVWADFIGYTGPFASTSGADSPCLAESLTNDDTPYHDGIYTGVNAPCITGGIALTTNFQDAFIAISNYDGFCSAASDECYLPPVTLSAPQGIATDGLGQEWFANSGNASVSTVAFIGDFTDDVIYATTSPIPYLHDSANGNTMAAPYGIAIDGSGNVWVSNASCVTTSEPQCTPASLVLSELLGAGFPTITPLSNQDGGLFAGTPPGISLPLIKSQPAKPFVRTPPAKTSAMLSADKGHWPKANANPAASAPKHPTPAFKIPWLSVEHR